MEPVLITSESDRTQGESIPQESHRTAEIPKGFGRITRDEAGRILHIEMAEENEECQPDTVSHMGTFGLEIDKAVLQKWTTTLGVPNPNVGPLNIVQGMA